MVSRIHLFIYDVCNRILSSIITTCHVHLFIRIMLNISAIHKKNLLEKNRKINKRGGGLIWYPRVMI